MGNEVTRYVAFLRGMNLGKRRLEMGRLRAIVEEIGYDDVATFIASGNVIFSTRKGSTREMESRIAEHLERALGYKVDTFVRTLDEVAEIAGSRPFPEDGASGVTIHVGLLHDALDAATARKLAAVRTADDEFMVTAREYYWLCRIRTSDSKIWASPAMKAVSLPASTMRNMSSIRKLAAKHVSPRAPLR